MKNILIILFTVLLFQTLSYADTIILQPGWNMFSLPSTTSASSIKSQCGTTNNLWHYNTTLEKYESSDTIEPGYGYWLKLSSPCSILYSTITSIYPDLKVGWNQIGALSTVSFNSIKGSCNVLNGPWKYNPSTGKYEFNNIIEPGYGYWIKVANDCKLEFKNCIDYLYNGDPSDKLDLLFIPDNYVNLSKFENDLDLISKTLLSYEPFKSNSRKINIRWINKSANYGCDTYNCYIYEYVGYVCTDNSYTDLLFDCPADKVFIIINQTFKGGCTFLGGRDAWVSSSAKLTATIHELGHSFGRLFDEYTAYAYDSTDQPTSIINCDTSSCSKWSGVAGTGCYKGCYYQNWYRPSASCMMNKADTFFCPICDRRIRNLLDQYS